MAVQHRDHDHSPTRFVGSWSGAGEEIRQVQMVVSGAVSPITR